MKYSDEQLQAIEHKEGNLLVSASAGSGKTAVLTERVYRILKDNVPENSLLVLTFTNYAALEMRDRIRQKLIDGGFDKIASNVDSVNFQTYDAFALGLVKKYRRLIGLTSDVKIVDQTLIELEKKKQIRAILDEKYDKEDKDVISLVNKYCLKSDDKIVNLILSIYADVDLKFEDEKFLNEFVESFYEPNHVKELVDSIFKIFEDKLRESISKAKYISNVEFVDILNEYLLKILDAHSFKDRCLAYKEAYPRLDKKYEPDFEDKRINSEIKDSLKLYAALFEYESIDEIYSRVLSLKKYASTIFNLVKELKDRLSKFKAKYSVYTFQDIFKLALKIVSLDEVKAKLKKQFKYIMIDEYQDTSDLQELFVSLISNNNVFAVGDIKQSIYRFRNANPDLFQSKFDNYKLCRGGKLITLPSNYRSRKEVIEDNNALFKGLMTPYNSGLDYQKDHTMLFGNSSYEQDSDKDANYHTECLNFNRPKKEDNVSLAEYEARLIATDIVNRYNAHTQVKAKDGGLRDIELSDFAILMYAKTNFKIYQKVFNEYGIPLYANYTQSIRDNNLTYALKNIIKLISMYRNDIFDKKFLHSFVSILRSFLIKEDDDRIDMLFSGNLKYEDFDLYNIIQNLSNDTLNDSLEDLTKKIFKTFDIYDKSILIGDIQTTKDLTNYFLKLSKEMDEMNYSLDDYSKYYDELDEYEIEPEYNGAPPSVDSVKLMTIHASKGLQFKYVYYAGLYKSFKRDATGLLLFDDNYGLDLPNTDYSSINGVFHNFISSKAKKATILEQLRVFYVALTRAEEKAILLNLTDYRKSEVSSFDVANSYLDFYHLSNVNFGSYELTPKKEKLNLVSYDEKKVNISILDSYTFKDDKHIILRASKSKSEDADNKALMLGNRYHYYLELIDFSTKDTSFIKDVNDRKRIDKFLSNPIFDKLENTKIAHEYAFYDEVNDIHGVIDLLIVHDDHIDIVDYKLSNVDDINYEKQVKTYKDYVSRISPNKDINLYILGILSGDVKKVC